MQRFLFSLLATTSHLSLALAPPHFDEDFQEQWESVRQMRKRKNQTFTYHPKHVTEEYCRYMTEEECQYEDENLGGAIAGSFHPAVDLLDQAGRHRRRLNPSIGDVKVLVLLVKFKGHEKRKVPPLSHFDQLFNGGKKTKKVNPVGSIRDYLRYSSLGKYNVEFDVRDWVQIDETEAFYAEDKAGRVGERLQEFFIPALEKVDDDDEFNWYDGYIDTEGNFNHLVVLHSGYGAEYGDKDCISEPFLQRIWSQALTSGNGWRSKGYLQLNGFAVGSAHGEPTCKGKKLRPVKHADMSIITHEYMHGFGLPDLYDQDDEPIKTIGGTGRFDIMSNYEGWTQKGYQPGHLSAYSRTKAQWLYPIEITVDGAYAIQPAETSSHVYKISLGFPQGEYLLIENRQALKWDSDWEHSGIVITHVDELAPSQTQRGYPGHPGWPAEHYMVSILQADGKYDIEKGKNIGDGGDFWTSGMSLGPGTDGVWPNTDSYQGGVQRETGITIKIHTESAFIMVFEVSGLPTGESRLVTKPTGTGSQDSAGSTGRNPDTVAETTAWVLSIIAGVGMMVGVIVVLI